MKTPSILIFILALTLSAGADTDLTREQASAIKPFDVQKLAEQAHAMEGQIVKIRFSSRQTTIENQSDGSALGGVYQFAFDARDKMHSGYFDVVIPKEAADWFTKITTDSSSRRPLMVYARIEKGQNGRDRAVLLGREIRTDMKGARIVWGSQP